MTEVNKKTGNLNAFQYIPVGEMLSGPQKKDTIPKALASAPGGDGAAVIHVDAAKVLTDISPYIYGMNMEDLNHEIYGGLYAQLIFGESFEEGPDDAPPPGWIWSGYVHKNWKGMKTFDQGVVSMQAIRNFQLVWKEVIFRDGIIECDAMQPAEEAEGTVNVIFRAQVSSIHGDQGDVQDRYSLHLDIRNNEIHLRKGTGYFPNQHLAAARNLQPAAGSGQVGARED